MAEAFKETEGFGQWVSPGDRVKVVRDGFTLTATLHLDGDHGPPWEEEEGHGTVLGWTREPLSEGQLALAEDRGSRLVYDVDDSVRKALEDGWVATKGRQGSPYHLAKTRAAVMKDYEALKAWCDNEWSYFGVAVTASRAGVDLTGEYSHAVWGIDGNHPHGDNRYFLEVADDLADAALSAAKEKLAEMLRDNGGDPELSAGDGTEALAPR